MPIIQGSDLASYPGVTGTATELDWVAQQFDALVYEAWACPVEPVPAWVKTLTLNAAARFVMNPKGLESWTRSIDDGSRTERMPAGTIARGVALTDDELTRLSCADVPSGVGTIWTVPRCR